MGPIIGVLKPNFWRRRVSRPAAAPGKGKWYEFEERPGPGAAGRSGEGLYHDIYRVSRRRNLSVSKQGVHMPSVRQRLELFERTLSVKGGPHATRSCAGRWNGFQCRLELAGQRSPPPC